MAKFRVKPWYGVLVALWAVLIAPGFVLGLAYSGGRFNFEYQSSRDIFAFWAMVLLFVLPLILLPFGFLKRNRD